MNKFKKTLSVVMAALMLVFTVMTYVPANAAETAAPEVAFVGVDHSPLVAGDTEMFTLTTKNADKVQYNVVLNDAAGKLVEDLTKGYTAETAGNVPFAVKAATVFAEGKYTLVVNAKRVSDGKVATYSPALNCVSKDKANRIFANGAVDIAKTDYAVGEKVVVNGVKDLGGIDGPYVYKLHVYNATTGTWTKNVVANYGDKLEWTPTVAGTYVLDIYVNSQKSTTWAKYAKNPSSDDVYGTYEAWKLVTINVVDALKVTGVKAPNKETIKVTYNMDVKDSAVAANFGVYDKGNQYSQKSISSVSVDKNVVTLKLADKLVNAKEYTVESKNVAAVVEKATAASSKDDFTYTEVKAAASIAFKATTVGKDETLEFVIKDKDGNDITANIDGNDVVKAISDEDYVTASLVAKKVGNAIVNLTIKDTTITTGNTIITIVDTLSKPTSIDKFGLVGSRNGALDTTKLVTSVSKADTTKYVQFQVNDQDDKEMDWDVVNTTPATNKVVKTFKSYSPSVAVVDETTGQLFPVAIGTATIYVTAKDVKGTSVSKALTIEVKDAPKVASIKLEKTSVTLVNDSTIGATVKVTLLDQYGQAIADSKPVSFKLGKTIANLTNTENLTTVNTKGEASYALPALTGLSDNDATTLTITFDKIKAYVTVNAVKKGTFAGYTVVSRDGNKLDLTPGTKNSVGPLSTTIDVYEVDNNGNYVLPVTTGVALEEEAGKDAVTTQGLVVKAVAAGTETITVKLGKTVIGTVSYSVANAAPVLKTVSQVKSVVTVDKSKTTDVYELLFKGDAKAFAGFDQYGKDAAIAKEDLTIFSSNNALISKTTLMSTATANGGSVTLTFIIAEKVYTVIVNVK